MAKKETTYSVAQSALLTGYCRAMVSRLCQRGIVGRKIEIPESGQHIFRLSKKDIVTLKARKTQGIHKIAVNQ